MTRTGYCAGRRTAPAEVFRAGLADDGTRRLGGHPLLTLAGFVVTWGRTSATRRR